MLQQLLICSSLAEMDGTYALQTSITCEELLEPVRNLQPLLSAALKNHGGELSFVSQQQEHAHTLHHGNQVPSDGQAQDRNCGHDAHAHSDGHGHDGLGHNGNGHGHGHEHNHRVRTMASDMSTDDSDSICSSTMLDLIERNKLPQHVGTLSSSLLETQTAMRMTHNCGGSNCIKVLTCLTPVPPSSSSMMSITACRPELPSKQETPSRRPTCRLKLKRPKTATDTLQQAMEFSDESDEELGHNAKVIGSRNLACARMRRKQLNQKLFSLRALVPRITKFDRASVLGDAIRHVQELQMQVEDMQNDILSLQVDDHARFEDEHVDDEGSSHCANRGTNAENFWHNVPIHRVLELSVSNLEENLYHLKVRCKNGPGVWVQLTKALEALNLNIINAHIASMGNLVLNTVVFKVFNTDELLKPRELEERILETVHMFGFHF